MYNFTLYWTLLFLAPTITECILISAFPLGITSSAIGSNIYAIAAGIKKYTSIIKEKKKKHDKRVLLPKSKLNNIKVLISKALINSNISHDESILINNVLKEYVNMKEEIKI